MLNAGTTGAWAASTAPDATVSHMSRWAVLLVSVTVAYGCATQIVVPTGSPIAMETAATTFGPTASTTIEHPTGATDVVLRLTEYPGMPYPGMILEPSPGFTLYGDGRAIYSTRRGHPPPGTPLELRQAQLTDAQTDQLLADALGPGGLAEARAEYGLTDIYDVGNTYFEVHAGGVDKTIWVYGLGHFGTDLPDADARRSFSALAARLGTFAGEVASGGATDTGVFEPESYRATLSVPFHELEPTEEWPWPDLTPSDFAPTQDGNLFGTVTAGHAEVVLDADGEHSYIATGSDGKDYIISLRPLLPDEVA